MSKEEGYWPDIDQMIEKGDVDGLVSALDHEDFYVRRDAAWGLKQVGDHRAVPALIKTLKYEKWQDDYTILVAVRENAAEALGIIGDERAVKPLIEALAHDSDDDVRWKAAWSLGKIGSPEALDALITGLNDDTAIVRQQSAMALGLIGREEAVTPLIEALEDEEWTVRKDAVFALGEIGDQRAVKYLIRALIDEDRDVVLKAMSALIKIGTPAVDPLLTSFKKGNWRLREKSAIVLGLIGDNKAVDYFIKALSKGRDREANKYVRGRIAEALGRIGDPKAKEALELVLNDEFIFSKHKAQEALEKLESEIYTENKTHYDNGEISFDYPVTWEVHESSEPKKIVEGNLSSSNIKFFIKRFTNIADISQDELVEILEDVLKEKRTQIIEKRVDEKKGMPSVYILADKDQSTEMILINTFKSDDILYYIWFKGSYHNFNDKEKDIELILNSFAVDRT